ncbi:MAG TPA: glycosyl hydrolase, partial [Bacilli bacterium]
MKPLYEKFLEPGMEYRGKPFWSWNGTLEKEELLRQIYVFKEMGFGGFFMHSRTGLVTEYLGEEWFDLINACAEEAEKLGMEAWLYDEDRWPSGTAGGMVTQEPKYRMKFIKLKVIPEDEFSREEDFLAAFSCRLEGLAFYDCKQLDRQPLSIDDQAGVDEFGKPPAGKQILVFTIVEMAKESFYNGYTYVDTLNREATDTFLNLTHEKYKQACGDKFGKSIKGIFTDEPHRGTLLDGFGISNEDKAWHAPWTYTLFDSFKAKYGYDLLPRLPELFLQHEGRLVSQVKWHYVELLQEMFLENFAKPMNEWCKANHLILTGHILHEDNLTAQTAMSGSVMRCYEHMEYPGIDVLTEGNNNYWIAKQLQSAARQLDKRWLLSELYGCTGWQMPLEAHKSVGDWQALFGINLRCHHLSWYTMEGESKRDYPASISHQSTWWKDYS